MSYLDRAKNRGDAPQKKAKVKSVRLVSLDAFRGFIMIMLAAGGFGIAKFAGLPEAAPVWQECDYEWWQWLKFHFEHPAWESVFGTLSVSFWDLIQPSFMFMVGVAMPFSYVNRERKGQKGMRRFFHALIRSVVLVLLGVFLYSLKSDHTNWIFTNVLAQIGLGYFFVYLMLGRQFGAHLCTMAAIVLGYFFFFYMNPPAKDFDYAAVNAKAARGDIYEGKFAAWSKNANAASDFDLVYLNRLRTPRVDDDDDVDEDDIGGEDAGGTGDDAVVDRTDDGVESGGSDEQLAAEKAAEDTGVLRRWLFANPEPFTFNAGGYTTLNFVPSIVTMLLGLMCGQLLLGKRSKWKNLLILLAAGGICIVDGLLMHHFMCPIVKRIWTPGWALFSGGWVIWMLAAFYFVFDVLPLKKLAFPLVVVGMNSLAIYMMGQLLRPWVADKIVATHLTGFMESVFGTSILADDMYGRLIYPTATFAIFWLIAFWMYCKKLFVRI